MKFFYVQSKVREREKIRTSCSNNNSDEHAETGKSDDSSAEEDVDSRLVFARTLPDDAPMQKPKMP